MPIPAAEPQQKQTEDGVGQKGGSGDKQLQNTENQWVQITSRGKTPGSFGEIVKAGWRGTPVAVKRILPNLSDDRLVMYVLNFLEYLSDD
ncbi:hypothetical protein BUALT_Bualt17G0074400 [Buddleja alternifolia]|uniref:Uncharacterized protein n=1 Tax=Buddleja alternifolia TaxID=168488 RepID=A0AAV6WDE6_9LAMI|nr:hypothetical protein BUALT_Bualt17G0074400 [Buddleja alternifolia]